MRIDRSLYSGTPDTYRFYGSVASIQ